MSCQGTVKSFNDSKQYGFISMDGSDVFLHATCCQDGFPAVGDTLTFDVELDDIRQGQQKAKNVTGCSRAEKGQGKGNGGNVVGGTSCQGTVKSFSEMKGYGFAVMGGVDVFIHVNDCLDGVPQVGDVLSFDAEESPIKPGTQKAFRITGCSGVKGADGGKGKGGCDGSWAGGCAAAGPYGKGMGGWGGGWDGMMGGMWPMMVKGMMDGRGSAGKGW